MPYLERQGAMVYFEEHGQEGTPLVLLHSLGTSSRLWDRQIASFKETFRIVVVDARGHGNTRSSDPFSMRDCALDVVEVLKHLNIPSAHILGLSMGGHVAMELYASFPELVRSLLLCDTFPKIAEDIREDRIQSRLEMLKQPNFEREWAVMSLHPDASEECITETVDMFGCTRESYGEAWVAVMNVDYTGVLPKVAKPALVLTGDNDRSAPLLVAQGMHQAIPGSSLAVVENAGHLSNLSNPEHFNRLIMQFLTGL